MSERATDAERAYWRKLAEASERLRDGETAPASMSEVFRRMESLRARLGVLAEPGLAPDDEQALAESVRLHARWRAKEARERAER
ncbi:MAG: hypothetical protein OZ948_12855 [Deltaproteobacteria bacterium]|nr:hypothetical protein [Deltaproteobacteria bacterium]